MVDMMMLLITFFMLCTSLSKPQAMLLTMPSNDQNVQERDKTATKASQTITIYVTGNDKIYYIAGLPNYEERKPRGVRTVSAAYLSTTLPKTERCL